MANRTKNKKPPKKMQIDDDYLEPIYLQERELKSGFVKVIPLFEDFIEILEKYNTCDDNDCYNIIVLSYLSDSDFIFQQLINCLESLRNEIKNEIKIYMEDNLHHIYFEEDFDGWKLFIQEYESLEEFKDRYEDDLNAKSRNINKKNKSIRRRNTKVK